MQRNLFIIKSVKLTKPVSLITSSILLPKTLFSRGSTVNGEKYEDIFLLESSLTITKASVLKEESVIAYGSSISILPLNLKNFEEGSYIDVTDMAEVTKSPELFNQLVKMYNDINIEKEIMFEKLDELKREINTKVVSFNDVKDAYQQRISTLQQRNLQLVETNEKSNNENQKLVEEEKFIIKETEKFKSDLEKKERELKVMGEEIEKLDSLFNKIAESKRDGKVKIQSLKDIFSTVFNNESPDNSFVTIRDGIRSMIEQAESDILISQLVSESINKDEHNAKIEELQTETKGKIDEHTAKIEELEAALEASQIQFSNMKDFLDLKNEETELLNVQISTLNKEVKNGKSEKKIIENELSFMIQEVSSLSTEIRNSKSEKKELEAELHMVTKENQDLTLKLKEETEMNEILKEVVLKMEDSLLESGMENTEHSDRIKMLEKAKMNLEDRLKELEEKNAEMKEKLDSYKELVANLDLSESEVTPAVIENSSKESENSPIVALDTVSGSTFVNSSLREELNSYKELVSKLDFDIKPVIVTDPLLTEQLNSYKELVENLSTTISEFENIIKKNKETIKSQEEEIEHLHDENKKLNGHLDDLHYSYTQNEEELLKTVQNLEEANNNLEFSQDKVSQLEKIVANINSDGIINEADNNDMIEMSNVIRELTYSLKKIADELAEQKHLSKNLSDENGQLKDNTSKLSFAIENAIERVSEMNARFDNISRLISSSDLIHDDKSSVPEIESKLEKLIATYKQNKELLSEQINKVNITEEIIKKMVLENSGLLKQNKEMKSLIELLSEKIKKISENSSVNDASILAAERDITASYKAKCDSLNEELAALSDGYVELRANYENLDSLNKLSVAKLSDLRQLFNDLSSKVAQISSFDIKNKVLVKVTELISIEEQMNSVYVNFVKGRMDEKQFVSKGTTLQESKKNTTKSISDILDYIDTIINV